MAFNSASIARMKSFYLKGVLAVYVVAFASLYVQVQSLFGDNGLVPLRDYAAKAAGQAASTAKVPLQAYNLILLAPKLGFSHGTVIELLCIVGVLVAFSGLLVRRLANALSFGLLWYIYYSISSVGQGFMNFHSDLMLLEVGFISILLAPLLPSSKPTQADHDHLTFFLVRWLCFRYFVSNVLSIYLENDKTVYTLDAPILSAHGVPFPSLFTWHCANASPDTVKIYFAYESAVQLCAPFLLLFDLKLTRLIAFYTLLFVAVPSAFFLNYGWTDLLVCVCLISFLKDAYFYKDKRAKQSAFKTLLDILVLSTYVSVVAAILLRGFGVKYGTSGVTAKVLFTPTQFKLLVDHLVPASLVVGSLGLLSSAYTTFFRAQNKTSIIKTLAYSVVVVGLFLSTFPTLLRLAPGLETKVKPLAYTKEITRFTAPYQISNNYAMAWKISQHYAEGRPELQIQGRKSAEDPDWYQFDLKYKPGHPSRELSRVLPHVPRIELKLWYAARSSLQNNQWLQTLAYRLVTKEGSFMSNLASPPPESELKQVRVALNILKYSSKTRQPFAGYWSQSKFKSEYMPGTSVENLKFAVKSNGISLVPPKKGADGKANTLDKLLSQYLEMASDYIRNIDSLAVIWSLSAIAAVSMLR